VQAELGAPPQHVVGALRPLVAVEELQFGFVQARGDLGTETLVGVGEQQPDAGTVQPGPAGAHRLGQLRMPFGEHRFEAGEVGVRPVRGADPGTQVAARQRRPVGPGAARHRQRTGQQVRGFLGELAEGRDLAAPHRQERRALGVEFEQVVPRHGRGIAGLVVEKGPHPGIGPDHVGRADGRQEVAARLLAQVADFGRIDAGRADGAVVLDVGGADQREVALVGDREDDALVGVLEDVGMVVVEELRHDDVAALDEPQRLRPRCMGVLGEELRGPGAGGVDEGPGLHLAGAARVLAAQGRRPAVGAAPRVDAGGARQHGGAALGRIDRVQHHEPRIVDPAVGVDEAAGELRLERPAGRMLPQVDRARAGQHLTPRQVVVEEEAGTDHPHRTQAAVVRHHEAQRPHDVRRRLQQHLALGQRLAHERELVVLEVAQTAVDQLGRRGRGVGSEVVLLAQHHRQAAAGEIAGDAGAVDATADDEHVTALGGGGRSDGHGQGGRLARDDEVRLVSFVFDLVRL
jgi:hypothetical protein